MPASFQTHYQVSLIGPTPVTVLVLSTDSHPSPAALRQGFLLHFSQSNLIGKCHWSFKTPHPLSELCMLLVTLM